MPNAPRLKTKTDNSSFIEVTWDVPAKPAGPIDYSLVSVLPDGEDQEGLDPIRVEGGETQLLLALEEVCTPGAELRVRVMAVNQAENKADLYMSGWSDEGVYQCKSEGIAGHPCHVLLVLPPPPPPPVVVRVVTLVVPPPVFLLLMPPSWWPRHPPQLPPPPGWRHFSSPYGGKKKKKKTKSSSGLGRGRESPRARRPWWTARMKP